MQTFKQFDDLKSELDHLLAELQNLIEGAAGALTKIGGVDTAQVTFAIGKISVITNKFLFLLPEISKARAGDIDTNGALLPADAHKWSQLENTAYRTRTWITQWPTIETLLRSQIPPKRRKLFHKPIAPDDISAVQNRANDALLNDLYNILNAATQNEAAREHGCFADISLPQTVFLEHIHAAKRILLTRGRNHPMRFLDVGCGAGLKVLSAAGFFDRADGLEFDPGYVEAAKTLFKNSRADRCDVIHADGLTYSDYDVYDAVYFYRPMRHIELLRKLEDQIVKNVRPGTLIIAPYKMFDHRFEELGCARIDRQIYITQTSQSDAKKLRRDAELTGSFVQFEPNTAPSIWDPILQASKTKGFGAVL